MGDSDTEGPAAAVNAFFRQHHKQHIVCLRCIKVFDPTKSAARNHPHLHCGSPTEEEDPDEVMLEVADFTRAKSKKHAHDITTKLIAARDKAIRAGVAADRAARRAPAAAADEAATGDEGTEEGDDQDGDSSSEEVEGEGTDSEEEEGTRDPPAVNNPADSARATATARGNLKQPTRAVTKDILTAVVLSLRIVEVGTHAPLPHARGPVSLCSWCWVVCLHVHVLVPPTFVCVVLCCVCACVCACVYVCVRVCV